MSTSTAFEKASWIWCTDTPLADEYGDFYAEFHRQKEERITLSISADSNYAVYLNGTLCAFGQYHDYPYDKVFDTIDLTPLCREGKNRLAITVWYYGESCMSYYPGRAGLLFAVRGEGGVLCASGVETLSRLSPTYENHRQKQITSQLGFGFAYDATREDGWIQGECRGFAKSIIVDQKLPLRLRPCERLTLETPVPGAFIGQSAGGNALFDLGRNTVGFLRLTVTSPVEQRLSISYGEHITDVCVRRIIGHRDFSVDVTVRAGETVYLNPFRRLGCRYLEVSAPTPLTDCRIEVVPTTYPVKLLPPPAGLTQSEQEIYDICVNTLRLCMHEHYEDCPWREQALYCMDSRNQMLCGYYAFGETAFPRANLELIAVDEREDGLLSICYPSRSPLAIPSFSLHYFTECAEYLRYSGDKEFLRRIYPKLERVLAVFLCRRDSHTGLVPPFPKKEHWNFYEWRKGLNGSNPEKSEAYAAALDLPLNTLLSLALQRMAEISDALGIPNTYAGQAKDLNQCILHTFLDAERGLCFDRVVEGRTYSVLGNALAVLCGAVSGETARSVCESLVSDETLTPISVSMQCFLFDALLHVDRARYAPYVLDRIEQTYRPMVDLGLGTVWETERGEADFGNAGSLCHGWSAMPVYYYHILKA
jgi:hypothetical protein